MAPGPRIAGLRRFAASTGMHFLAMLVMVALPLNGASLAVSSIVSPAHYHVAGEQAALVDVAANAPRVAPGSIDADAHHFETSGVQHHPGQHDDHHEHATGDVDNGATPDNEHHQDHAATDSHHDGGIGRHRHGLEQADVVYVEGDPERTDPVNAGKHVSGGAEAALPARSLAILPAPDPQLVPRGIGLFVSRESEPPLRPPSARGSSHA